MKSRYEPADGLEEVRAALAEKANAGYVEAVRRLMEKYGARKLSDIAVEDYPAVLVDARGLGE